MMLGSDNMSREDMQKIVTLLTSKVTTTTENFEFDKSGRMTKKTTTVVETDPANLHKMMAGSANVWGNPNNAKIDKPADPRSTTYL